MEQENKKCSCCKKFKLIEEFSSLKICKFCKENIAKARKKRREENPEFFQKKRKESYLKNKQKENEQSKKYHSLHKEKINKRHEKYNAQNKEQIRKKRIELYHKKLKFIPQFRLRAAFSKSLRKALKQRNKTKTKSWELLLGYSAQDLKIHLEKQFDSKMNWENYGSYWHVDHINPESWFNYNSIEDEEFKICWSLNNLQPLEASENYRKGNRYEG